MTDTQAYRLGEAIRMALDEAMEDGCDAEAVKAEVQYQLENYDWEEL